PPAPPEPPSSLDGEQAATAPTTPAAVMEGRMERRFSMDDLLEAGRVRERAQAQMRRVGWLQTQSARRGREGAGAMSDRELRASGRRGVGSGERGVGSGSAERGERGVESGSAERGERGVGSGSAER